MGKERGWGVLRLPNEFFQVVGVPEIVLQLGVPHHALQRPLQSIVHNAISMARVIGITPPSGVAIVVISVDATSLW